MRAVESNTHLSVHRERVSILEESIKGNTKELNVTLKNLEFIW